MEHLGDLIGVACTLNEPNLPYLLTTTAFVPADPVRIWELVSDPRRRPEWDTLIGSAVPVGDGLWQLEAAPVRPDGRRARVSRRYRRSRLALHAGPAALQRFVAHHLLIAQGAGIARVLR